MHYVPRGNPAGTETRSTARATVMLATAAGALAAFQVGKVHIALPSVRHSFALGLVSASWLLSALSLLGC